MTDRAPWHADYRRPPKTRSTCDSRYLAMRDGNRIAVDVHLPSPAPRRPVPAILRQTRYYRGVAFRPPFSLLNLDWLVDHTADTRQRFLDHGYAWVDVCVRGSGASFGTRPCPWSPDEIADGPEVVDWIVAQPWSNGLVGSTGVSYDGTTAEFLAIAGHPAVRAIVPRFCLYDVFADVAFPGGIHLSWFTERWGMFNQALDQGGLDQAFALKIKQQIEALRAVRRTGARAWLEPLLAVGERDEVRPLLAAIMRQVADGVRPVPAHPLSEAVASHGGNFDVHRSALLIDHRDDTGMSAAVPEASIDYFSPHVQVERLRASGAAVYGYSGWLDAAYQHAAVKRFGAVDNPGSRLIVGPWDHGGLQNISPHCPARASSFDHHAEMVRFFDHHLRGEPDGSPAVRYFTIGEERWKESTSWPPPEARASRLYLAEGRTLSTTAPARDGVDEHRLVEIGTGNRSRWNSLLGLLPPVGYNDQASERRHALSYRGAPLERDVEVSGHAIASLDARCDRPDAHVFVYLQDEHPDGRVDYVTEGQLRALHRHHDGPDPRTGVPRRGYWKSDARPIAEGEPLLLEIDLLPISWLFRRGHRICLAITGTDRDHFESLPFTPTIAVLRGGQSASFVDLPVVSSIASEVTCK